MIIYCGITMKISPPSGLGIPNTPTRRSTSDRLLQVLVEKE